MKKNPTTPTAPTEKKVPGQLSAADQELAKAMIELLTDLGSDGNDSMEGLFARERLYFDGISYLSDRFDAISDELKEALEGGAA
ncbi:hypothetical protein DESC_810085 [Desulfosarcina cetonica]|nr:hypothetical protein DESC_810085 [Desulfosarcina cetonica]